MSAIDFRVKKTKDPAPGTYNTEDAFRKTQWANRTFMVPKSKNKSYIGTLSLIINDNYIDIEVKRRSFAPGIGKYKEIEKGY